MYTRRSHAALVRKITKAKRCVNDQKMVCWVTLILLGENIPYVSSGKKKTRISGRLTTPVPVCIFFLLLVFVF